MRVRNLMSKPNAVDYIMVKPRWGSKLSAEDGHITLNTGTNNTGVERTEFDILANQDTNIKASPSNANIQLVTDLPDCQLCLAFTAKALTGMTVRLLTAWWNGTLWKSNRNDGRRHRQRPDNVPVGIATARAGQTRLLQHPTETRCRHAGEHGRDASVGFDHRYRRRKDHHESTGSRRVQCRDRALRGGSGRGGGIPLSPRRLDWGLAA